MELTIDRYTHLVAPVRTDDLDLERAFAEQPLSADILRCLRYMHDIEMHTVCYLRDLLVTSAHRDVEITTFLTCWAYEEYWHGEALGRVLHAHGEVASPSRVAQLRRSRRVAEALKPLFHGLGSAVFGPAMTAVHMSWGAINEYTTQAGYARVSQVADHEVLSELLSRIMRQEGRHIDFYVSQAKRRLAASSVARRVTRTALDRLWRPVGSDVMPQPEVDHLRDVLFAGEDGRAMAARVDRRIDHLPGLDGLNLLSRASGWVTQPRAAKSASIGSGSSQSRRVTSAIAAVTSTGSTGWGSAHMTNAVAQ